MFLWLTSWFKKPEDIYSIKERLIYHYNNGERVVHADPLVLYRRIMDEGAELNQEVKVANSIHPDNKKFQKLVASRIRKLFQIKPLTNDYEIVNTLGDVEVMNLLSHFMDYCASLKKNIEPSPTTSMPTEDWKIISRANRLTSNTAGFGSTAATPSTAKPEPQPSVSE